ncbi:hypothetical protein [Streptomyces noursei]|uniref:hypothetical protein n=1 Tax=Streptomyces noursei TaxID=1971 RepID=UPI001679BE43|nr:hypothetical protein [Streptomyces noursei]MCZ1013037.1 hypothetical protein [Streptomyces noursei]GGX45606.1 hypothetical protein GCM10010341_79220 [Streptomyces noursei]
MVTVEAPGPGEHTKALQLKGQLTSASGRWTTGDRLAGGLYAPDAPSLGIILTPRRHLASLLGGPASPGEMVMLATFSALPTALFLMRVRSGAKNGAEPATPQQALASALEDQAGWLYWAPVAEDPPDWSVPALLILDDDRYVFGLTPPGSVVDLPQGEPVNLPVLDARPMRAVGPYALWQPAVHGPDALWQPAVHGPGSYGFGLAFLAVCLIVAGVDYDGGPLLSMCFLTAAGGPLASLLLIQRLRTTYLRRLAQQT